MPHLIPMTLNLMPMKTSARTAVTDAERQLAPEPGEIICPGASINNIMKPHEQRVIEEKAKLHENAIKLSTFIESEIFKSLSDTERSLLLHQLQVMKEYLEILGKRIANFTPEDPKETIRILREELESRKKEREEAIRAARIVCMDNGFSNDWTDALHLADVIERRIGNLISRK